MTPFLRNLQIETKLSGKFFKAANFQVRHDGSFITGDIAPITRRLLSAAAMQAKIDGIWTRENRRGIVGIGVLQKDQIRLP